MPNRICIHWTAGNLNVSRDDSMAYHFISDGNGVIHDGHYTPEDNDNLFDGYARHTRFGNTKTIGVAVCGAYKGYKFGAMTRVSFEAMLKKVAELCKRYSIPITEFTVYHHWEFEQRLSVKRRSGKQDITSIPWKPDLKKEEVGRYIRQSVLWYYNRL